MAEVVFIGDEVSAAGFRLAGVDVRSPPANEIARVLQSALGEAGFVIVTAAYAAALPAGLVDELVSRAAPPLLIVPDAVEGIEPPDYGTAVARALGIAP